jgi:hemoglobin
MPSLFAFAGGEAGLHRLEDKFYRSVLADPLLQPLFGAGQPHHVEAEMPTNEGFRSAIHEHVEFGTQVAMQNSNAATDEEVHPLREVPRWAWAGDD